MKMMVSDKDRKQRLFRCLFIPMLMMVSVLLCACQKKSVSQSGRSAYIEITDLEQDSKPATGDQSVSSIPSFQVSAGEPTDEINRLNEIIDEIRESYERACTDDNEKYTIISEKTEGTRYLVTTMYITDDWISLTGRNRQEKNIVTLAYDKQKDAAITSTEALNSTGISGVSLSQQADEQLTELQKSDARYRGNLRSTEMQGFSLDENGKTDDIYMKLEIDTGKEDLESFFFHFDPENRKLTPLLWPASDG